MEHPLHLAVGNILESIGAKDPSLTIILDPACSAKSDRYHIPLFNGDVKSRGNRLCCVDAAILYKNELIGIIEIEETGFLPTKICGKFMTSAFSSHVIHSQYSPNPTPVSKSAFFVQVIDSSKFSEEHTAKIIQFSAIEGKIRNLISQGTMSIINYSITCPNGPKDTVRLEKIKNDILSFIPK